MASEKKVNFQSGLFNETDWLREIRLLVNKRCNYRCGFPDSCAKWCHEDGAHFFSDNKEASFDDFIFIANHLRQGFNLVKAKIAGMEPLLFPKIGELIKELKKIGYQEVSMTTNGYFLKDKIADLADSGLDTLTISIHSMNPEIYKRITGTDGLAKVLRGIKEAKKMGIKKIKVNRVMLKFDHVWDDLMKFIDWASREGVSIKLYELILSDKVNKKDYFNNYLSWRSLLGLFAAKAKLEEVQRFSLSGRERLFWRLDSGILVETDIFNHKLLPRTASFCKQCPQVSSCQEGLFSYGIEVNPELVVSPCLLRKDVALDVWNLVKNREGKKLVSEVDHFIEKLTK